MKDSVRANMRIAFRRFNSFFLAAGVTAAVLHPSAVVAADAAKPAPSKSSSKSKKEDPLAVVRLFTEVVDDGTAPKIEVFRRVPQMYAVSKQPFLDERDVARMVLLDTADGGFMFEVDFTNHGKQVLEMQTVSAGGRRLIIFGQWNVDGQEKPEERWLAAPLIKTPIHDGTLRFSADCSREEAERIVEGANAVAVKMKNQPKSKTKTKATKNDKSKAPTASPNSAAQEAIEKGKQ